MTLFPLARWRGPVPNQGGAMGPIHGLVLHIQEGSEAGTDAWFRNPASKVSAHFGNPKTGQLDQWVEVGTVAWAEVNGNTNWVSIETEGHSGDSLTASQLENVAQLLAWLHTAYGVPLQISDSTVPGLTGHGLGGAAWGGHYDCPGAPILAQRQAIINRAAAILGGAPTTGGTVSTLDSADVRSIWGYSNGDHPDVHQTLANAAAYAAAANAKLDQLLGRPVTVPVDVVALAAALAPHITVTTDVGQLAADLLPHLPGGVDVDALATALIAHVKVTP